jgi:hypothetical protein
MGEGRGGFEITSRNQFMYGLSVGNDTWSYSQIRKQRDTERHAFSIVYSQQRHDIRHL